MAKKDEVSKEAEGKASEAKITGNRPELETGVGIDRETLSHNWQPGSPAIDMRYPGTTGAVNTVAEAAAAKEKSEVEVKEKPISDAEYEERTKLDVSSPRYINESLDHKTGSKTISESDHVQRNAKGLDHKEVK